MKRLAKTNWRNKRLRSKLRKHWHPAPGTRVYLPYRRDTSFAETGFILRYKEAPGMVEVGFNRPLFSRGFAQAKSLIRRTFKLRDLRPAPQSISPKETLTLLADVL